jgi:murein L,D-transpeptidase YafK
MTSLRILSAKSCASKKEGLPKRGKAVLRACLLSGIVITTILPLPACVSKEDRIRKAFARQSGNYLIYVTKKRFRLEVYNRRVEPVAAYTVAIGSNPDMRAKLYEGDNRTPEGEYVINEILSMDADKKSTSYRTLKKMNSKFFRAKDGHSRYGKPDEDLGDNAYGPRFFGINYPNGEDRKRYRNALRGGALPGIGHGIGIHGNNDENGVGRLSSNGCIRMYNRDIVECEQYIQMGTPVIIVSD